MTERADLRSAIARAAARRGLDPRLLETFVNIESGGNPTAQTGSYGGLLQLGADEFDRYGGGDIYSVDDNLNAGAGKLADEAQSFRARYGREPEDYELYMIHQQGIGGGPAHLDNPDGLAWENMANTGEGRRRGPDWAKQAIWGNVPQDMRAHFPGGVDSLTSREFVDMWRDKVHRLGGGSTAAAPASGPDAAAPLEMASAGAPSPQLPVDAAGDLADVFSFLSGADGDQSRDTMKVAPAASTDPEDAFLSQIASGPLPASQGSQAEAINRAVISNMMSMARRGAGRRLMRRV